MYLFFSLSLGSVSYAKASPAINSVICILSIVVYQGSNLYFHLYENIH